MPLLRRKSAEEPSPAAPEAEKPFLRDWHFTDLVRARDGSLSQTKLAAASFHFALFFTVCKIQLFKDDFDTAMWTFYAAVAVGHAVYDKTMANVKDVKDRKMELDAGAAPKSSEPLPNP